MNRNTSHLEAILYNAKFVSAAKKVAGRAPAKRERVVNASPIDSPIVVFARLHIISLHSNPRLSRRRFQGRYHGGLTQPDAGHFGIGTVAVHR
jgi:hypothetical protein